MPARPPFLRALSRHMLPLAAVLVAAVPAVAVPPAAPTDLTVQFTRYGFPYNIEGTATSNAWYSWFLTWKDNALDEDGYQVQARFGNAGPFFNVKQLEQNSTFARVSGGIPTSGPGTPVQFRIMPWKFNGSLTESSSTLIVTTIPPRDTRSELAAPSSLTTSLVDRDPNTPGVQADDGTVRLVWSDNSSGELYHRLRIREHGVHSQADSGWEPLVIVRYGGAELPFNLTTLEITNLDLLPTNQANPAFKRVKLVPGKTYEFEVGAGNTYGNDGSLSIPGNYLVRTRNAITSPAQPATHFTVPDLLPPTFFSASPQGEAAMLLTWQDNSSNETGYQVQYRQITGEADPPWLTLGTVGENVTNVSLPIIQTALAELRVRAIHAYRPTGATTDTIIYSAFSNPATTSTTAFRAPSGLTATTSGVARTVNLAWQDNSASESGFNIYCRPAGSTGAYLFCRATPANVTKVSVDSFTDDSPFTSNTLDFTPFTVGSAYEFVVRAVGNDEDIETVNSNSVSAFARDGFTSRLYQPIQQGVAFSHTLAVSNAAALTRFEAANLPPGLSLNDTTGLISGMPGASGHYPVEVRAAYAGGHTAIAVLDLRVLPALGSPVLASGAEVGDRKIGLNDPMVISLAGRFTDADTTAAVRMTTTKGSLDISLFNNLTPRAFDNFISYAAAGDYNRMTFHRLDRNFVLQGGYLRAVSAPRLFTRVNARPSPPNEPGISNIFGTIASAKVGARTSYARNALGKIVRDDNDNPVTRTMDADMGYVGNPDSASIDFFFNLGDNRTNLDNQNGGFTVFGRVSTPGLALLQQINQLPIGSYQNTNPANAAYQAALDKRIIIDGSLVPISSIPMDAATAPADMDIEKTVRVTDIQPIPNVSYTVNAVSENIATAVVEGTSLRVTGLAAGTRAITLTARDIDGNTATTTFNLIVTPGYKRPAITRQPVSATARAGATVRYTVTATGTALGYRWRKNGVVIPGQTGQGSATLSIASAQVSDEGEYDVAVYNEAESIFSAKARLDIIKPPVITGTLPSRLVEAGSELRLEANLTAGSPAPVFTWRRGTAIVPRQSTKTLLIPAATLADAGVYQATARNSSTTTATTTQATVVVIDKRDRRQVETPGTNVKLVAQAAGQDLQYQWYRILDNGTAQDIPSAQDPIYEITNVNPSTDAGSYACRITLPPGIDAVETHSTGVIFLAVSGRPQIADTLTLSDGIVGAFYNSLPNYGFGRTNNAVSVRISNLPPGLTSDAATGRIIGRPTKPGDYRVTFTATNKSGTSPAITRPMRVFSMGSGLSGSFMANVEASAGLNDNRGGRLNVSVTGSGTFTSTLQMGRDTFRSSGSMNLVNTVSDASGNSYLVYLGTSTIPRRGRPGLTLAFQIVEGSQSFSGVVTDGPVSASFSGYRQIWSANFRQGPLIMVSGQRYQDPLRHNLLLSLPDTHTSRTDLPLGDGYLSASVSLSGTVAFAGRMADGTRFTAAGIASPYINESLTSATRSRVKTSFFQMLNNNTASVLADLDFMISDRATANIGRSGGAIELPPANHVTGSVRWIKGAQPTSDRYYRAGFEAVTLSALGALYQPPSTGRMVINLPNVAGNAVLDFTRAGIDSATPNPDLPSFRVTTAHVGVVTGSNPADVKLSINPATGILSGSFKLGDNRRGLFEGLCISASESESKLEYNYRLPRAGGFFHLPATTAALAPFLSGRVVLRTPVITFTTQPTSVTINPGSSGEVSFTAEATGMPGLNYQWFFNGNRITNGGTIEGAQTRTLTIRGPADANVGSYVCVAFSGSISVPSSAATLTIRRPVSTVALSRSPTDASVQVGTQVVFTATPDGHPAHTYQWYKDNVLISGQTGPTYTLNTTADSGGSYVVKVRNDLNAADAFISSSAVTLSVEQPLTQVTLSRQPAGEVLRLGASVTFTAVADGTGQKTYTWFRDGSQISSGTSSQLQLQSLTLANSGNYTVRVSKVGSSEFVESTAVPLEVQDLIHNVVLTRAPTAEFLVEGTFSVTFTVTSQGGGAVKNYHWRRNGELIFSGTSPEYTISSLQTSDSGSYTCLVTSEADFEGELSNAVALQVLTEVTSVQLTRVGTGLLTVQPGGSLVLKATPDGSATHNYTWLLNGSPMEEVPGTDEVTLVAPIQEGFYTYRVNVTNPVTTEPVQSNALVIQVINSP